MKVTRRDFIKISGVTVAGAALSSLGFDLTPVHAYTTKLRIKGAKETATICCYCSVGCGIIAHTSRRKIINTEGDPDHPISEGTLCAKGAGVYQIANNRLRLKKPKYRASGSSKWKTVSWDWALDEIAKRIKATRDKTFVTKNAKGQVVNRCDGIAHVGGAALNNEECYTLQKWLRSLGLVYIEHEARI